MRLLRLTIQDLLTVIIFLSVLSSIDFLSPGFQSGSKALLYCLLLFSVFFLLVKGKIRFSLMTLLLWLWFITFFISGVLSEDLIHGLWVTVNTAAITLLLYLLFSQLSDIQLDKQLYVLWLGILIVVVIPSLLLLILPAKLVEEIASQFFLEGYTRELLRYKGVFANQNSFAFYLAIFVSLSVYFYSQHRLRVITGGITVIAFIFLLFTLSRAGIGFFIVFLLSYILLTLSSKKSFYLSCVVVLGGASFLLIDYSALIERFSGGFSGRDIIWVDVLQKWKDNPYFGLGPNQYMYLHKIGSEEHTLSAHNEYLSVLVNNGVVQITLFLFIVIVTIMSLLKGWAVSNSLCEKKNVSFLLSFVLALLFHQLFETRGFHPRQVSGLLFIVILVYADRGLNIISNK